MRRDERVDDIVEQAVVRLRVEQLLPEPAALDDQPPRETSQRVRPQRRQSHLVLEDFVEE